MSRSDTRAALEQIIRKQQDERDEAVLRIAGLASTGSWLQNLAAMPHDEVSRLLYSLGDDAWIRPSKDPSESDSADEGNGDETADEDGDE